MESQIQVLSRDRRSAILTALPQIKLDGGKAPEDLYLVMRNNAPQECRFSLDVLRLHDGIQLFDDKDTIGTWEKLDDETIGPDGGTLLRRVFKKSEVVSVLRLTLPHYLAPSKSDARAVEYLGGLCSEKDVQPFLDSQVNNQSDFNVPSEKAVNPQVATPVPVPVPVPNIPPVAVPNAPPVAVPNTPPLAVPGAVPVPVPGAPPTKPVPRPKPWWSVICPFFVSSALAAVCVYWFLQQHSDWQ